MAKNKIMPIPIIAVLLCQNLLFGNEFYCLAPGSFSKNKGTYVEVVSAMKSGGITAVNLIGKLFKDPEGKELATGLISIYDNGAGYVVFDEWSFPRKPLYLKDGSPAKLKIDHITFVKDQEIYVLVDNPFVTGFAGTRFVGFTKSFYNEEIAQYHEEREQYFMGATYKLPEGVNAHTFLRGCGDKIRGFLKGKEEEIKDFNAGTLIGFINNHEGKIRKLTNIEESLIRHNEAMGRKGIELIYGEQDRKFGVEANERFTLTVKSVCKKANSNEALITEFFRQLSEFSFFEGINRAKQDSVRAVLIEMFDKKPAGVVNRYLTSCLKLLQFLKENKLVASDNVVRIFIMIRAIFLYRGDIYRQNAYCEDVSGILEILEKLQKMGVININNFDDLMLERLPDFRWYGGYSNVSKIFGKLIDQDGNSVVSADNVGNVLSSLCSMGNRCSPVYDDVLSQIVEVLDQLKDKNDHSILREENIVSIFSFFSEIADGILCNAKRVEEVPYAISGVFEKFNREIKNLKQEKEFTPDNIMDILKEIYKRSRVFNKEEEYGESWWDWYDFFEGGQRSRSQGGGNAEVFTDPYHELTEGRTYYEVLGVARDAGLNDLKAAFRKLQKELHPDVLIGKAAKEREGMGLPDLVGAEYERLVGELGKPLKVVNIAYQVLIDSRKRSEYDRFLNTHYPDGKIPFVKKETNAAESTAWRAQFPAQRGHSGPKTTSITIAV